MTEFIFLAIISFISVSYCSHYYYYYFKFLLWSIYSPSGRNSKVERGGNSHSNTTSAEQIAALSCPDRILPVANGNKALQCEITGSNQNSTHCWLLMQFRFCAVRGCCGSFAPPSIYRPCGEQIAASVAPCHHSVYLYCHYIVVHLHDKQLYIQWS